jgi:hypothetical protein
MTTLRGAADILEGPGEPVRLHDIAQRAGFFTCSMRTLSDYAESIPAPADDIVERVAPNRLPLNVGSLALPYCSNKSPLQFDPSVRCAVIVLHGTGRNATGYYQSMLRAAGRAGKLAESIIVAPHFLTRDDVQHHHLGGEIPFWTNDDWKQGSPSLLGSAGSATLSSFSALDVLLALLTDLDRFPNLQRVVFAGHSAGGQFVNRYAAGTGHVFPVTYVVANPSSYLYMDKRRRPAFEPAFTFPSPIEEEGCGSINSYKYGLDHLNVCGYMLAVGEDQIRARYAQRRVTYLLGTDDNDPGDDDLDKSCAADYQGRHRYERGATYYDYLLEYYGPSIAVNHRFVPVPGVGHSAGDMFNSPEGIHEIFG